MKQLHSKIRMIILIAVAVMILFSPRLAVFAQENFTSDYSQTKYTEDDGFESGKQTASASLPVDTYGSARTADCTVMMEVSFGNFHWEKTATAVPI